MAVPVDPNNRLKDLGPAREIEAKTFNPLGYGAPLICISRGGLRSIFLGAETR